MVGGEAANTKFLVFCSTRQGLEHKIYHTRGESANHYTTDAAEQVTAMQCTRERLEVCDPE
jgi:hypothetical protein